MKPIKPTDAFSRPPEAGRLRMGEKGPNGQPRALRTWRFTSPDQEAIGLLAERYGGTPRPWNEPRANVPDQWQVTTDAAEVDVLLPEGALSCFYEKWTGAGCERRCDGVECTLPLNDQGDAPVVPCLCAANGVMLCTPKSRLSVVLPGLPFRGAWVFTTQSWNAAEELAAMEPLVQAMQGRGILRAKLGIEPRSKPGKKFVVARLTLDATPEELAGGSAGLLGIPVVPERQALTAGKDTQEPDVEGYLARTGRGASDGPYDDTPEDEDIVDAEIVEEHHSMGPTPEQRKRWEAALDVIEARSGLKRRVLIRGLCLSATDGYAESTGHLNPAGWVLVVDKAEALTERTVTGIDADGRLKVEKA